MFKLPKFRLFGKDDPQIETTIQPRLELRSWSDLEPNEKAIALQQIENSSWIKDYSREILSAIEYLNREFLRICPGKNLHKIIPADELQRGYGNESDRSRAAVIDFKTIFLHEKSEALVFRMLTVFAERYIKNYVYQQAKTETDEKKRREYVDEAYEQFDRLANCLNHIFEQFAVNALMTRNGLVPRQDEKITEKIYVPTLRVLSDPKWKSVSADLTEMFSEYRNENYPETITKAHRALQRFLQILVGEEGKNAQGEVGKLFIKAKTEGIIPTNRFTEPIIQVFQSFISSERATNSTAKPSKKTATALDALLIMNVVMVFLQHCLQENK